MAPFSQTGILGTLLGALSLTEALNVPKINARVLVDGDGLRDSYDYVIVGGGTAGMTIGDRLSEDGESEFATENASTNGGTGKANPLSQHSQLPF